MTDKNPVGRPRAFKTEDELKEKINAYIQKEYNQSEHKEDIKPLTVAGLQVFLDVCEDTYLDYAQGQYDDENNNFSGAIKKARKYIEADKLEKALIGKYNPTIAIFDLKNNHGYVDRVENNNINTNLNIVYGDNDDKSL